MSQSPDDELVDRYLSGECTPQEERVVERWARESPERAEMLRVMRDTLGAREGGGERKAGDVDPLAAWARLEREMRAPPPVPATGAPPRAPAIRTSGTRKPVVLPARRSRWPVAIALAAAAAVLVVATPALLRVAGVSPNAREASIAMREVVTGNAERATVRLPDGSRVMLAAASRLRYPEDLDRIVPRTIVLKGEAYFEVAHDAARPFVVQAAHALTQVLGTSFSVRAYESDTLVRVVVASGRVALSVSGSDSTARRVLGADELARLSESGAAQIERVDATRYLAWTDGRLVFDDTPLVEVAEQLERWYDVEVVLADSALARRRFTGAFAGESLDQVLSALAPPVHARYEQSGRSIVLHALSETP
jgi:ferric-dicitrate binding protein FerR (iron transport regulator)